MKLEENEKIKIWSTNIEINMPKMITKTKDGFFPFRTESAKNNPIKDLKEFFHVYPKTNLQNISRINRL